MEENKALEELQFIRKVIEETKQRVLHNGKDYIFWGVLIIIGMLSTYIFILNKIHFNYVWVWAVLIPAGWFFSIINRKREKVKHPSTYAGKIISNLWMAAGIAMTIIGFVGPASRIIPPMAISPIACIIVGGTYFVSGKIVGSSWFGKLAYGWWIGGIVMMFVVSIHQFLIMSLLMLFFQTIPGIILYRKYKKETAAVS